ncbi:hypothetical protein [Paenibacillus sp. DMB5]|nr:hypothetical protein [Paenibacillus sp. DMB5]
MMLQHKMRSKVSVVRVLWTVKPNFLDGEKARTVSFVIDEIIF